MIAEPAGLPAWLADQGREPGQTHQPAPRATGEARLRRVATSMPDRVRATRRLTQAQAQAWSDWYEASLQAGALPCTTTVWTAGSGAEAVTAYVTGTPTFDAAPGGGLWTLTVDLLLQDVVPDAGFAGVGGWTLPWPPAFPPEDDWEGGTGGGGDTEPAIVLLRFNALPLVDEVSGNSVTTHSTPDLVSAPAVAGQAALWDEERYTPSVTVDAAATWADRADMTASQTLEFFVSRAAGVSVAGNNEVLMDVVAFGTASGGAAPRLYVQMYVTAWGYSGGGYSVGFTAQSTLDDDNLLTTNASDFVSSAPSPSATMMHFALVAGSFGVRGYVDGVLQLELAHYAPERWPTSGVRFEYLLVRPNATGGQPGFVVDEVRLTAGERYTGTSFTPPTGPFPPPP